MTTIAYKDGILAADSGIYVGNTLIGSYTKIVQHKSGIMGGAAGNLSDIQSFHKWLLNGAKGDSPIFIDASGLIVSPNGKLELISDGQRSPIQSSFIAIGSGMDIAMGALCAGATAEQAVSIAIQLHAHSEGPITVLKI
jgi:20S proteasome alpha/beta subunit